MFKGKKALIILTILMTIVVVFALFACSVDDNADSSDISSITIASQRNDSYVLGDEVNLEEITILVSYNNGESKIVTVSDYMFSDSDRELFFVKGTNTVFINYEGTKVALQISVISREDVISFNAEFKSNGGSAIASQKGTIIETFYAPQRPGYTFDGWYTNYDLTGNKAIAPFNLNENIIFYAKWVDIRVCTIIFNNYYGDKVREFEVVYGESIDINDTVEYPAPEEIEGLIFSGWSSSEGNTEEITTNLIISAIYVSKDCLVEIFTDSDSALSPKIFQKKYGDSFDVNNFILPTKDGHVTRWVYYKNDETTFEELPSDGIITVKQEKIIIKPYNVINTYTIEIHNGIAMQDFANLKAGTIKTEQVYRPDTDRQSYTVNYGSNFNISNFIEKPYLEKPQPIEGYNVVWCLVVTTYTGELWYNAYHQIWNDTTQKFEAAEGGIKSEYQLTDIDGEYLATIKGDNANPDLSKLVTIENVKGDITIRPKYIKKDYTVTLRRILNNIWVEITTFSVPYLNDFKLYDKDLEDYEQFNFTCYKDVERSYLYRNVAVWLNDAEWNDVYWRSDSALEDDWTIEWFTESNLTANTKVDFTEENDSLGSIEIKNNLVLYCKDTDQRRYNVVLYYDYDFTASPTGTLGEIYKERESYEYLTENQTITLPNKYSEPIIRTYTHDNKNYDITYIFKGWYDFRYNDPSGYTGNAQNPESSRNRNMYFYAHYECTTTFNLLVYDKTQKTAYDSRVGFEGNHYDVQEETIFYQLEAGTVFNAATMLYKGRVELGQNTSGQRFYEKYAFIQWVNGELTDNYNSLLALYGGGDKQSSIVELNSRISQLKDQVEACEDLWGRLYAYDYGDFDLASYQGTILTVGDYNNKQVQKKIYEDALELIDNYDDNVATSNIYSQNMDDYKLYNESIYSLNNAYDYTNDDIENDNVKYKFLGWYVDENYVTPYIGTIDFEWFVAGENLTLYAKWADQEKGTEGLVFQKIIIGEETFLAVADIVDDASYKDSIYNGCGYNDLDNNYYSVNLNDQNHVPVSVGTNLDIQIPKEHGGDNSGGYMVIGILAEAFKRFANNIKSIAMPATLMFIEERAFYNCSLENFYISGSDYIDADDSRALYQTSNYIVGANDIDTVGNLMYTGINAYGGTLLSYANKSSKNYLTLLSNTIRIGNNAFSGASNLQYMDLGESLISIGDNALEAMALIGYYDTANSVGTDTLILPDTLEKIGNYAFKDSLKVSNISHSLTCALKEVGYNALKSTNWYNSQIGPILINNNLIGIRGGTESHFDKDGNGQIILYGDNVDEARLKSGNNYLYYKIIDNRYAITRVEINDTITSISTWAFLDYYTVTQIELNNCSALQTIFDKAFENCTNIENVYLRQATSTLKLGTGVFKNCPELNVYVPDKNNVHASFDNYQGFINLLNIV